MSMSRVPWSRSRRRSSGGFAMAVESLRPLDVGRLRLFTLILRGPQSAVRSPRSAVRGPGFAGCGLRAAGRGTEDDVAHVCEGESMLQLLTWTATGLVAGGLARTLMRSRRDLGLAGRVRLLKWLDDGRDELRVTGRR